MLVYDMMRGMKLSPDDGGSGGGGGDPAGNGDNGSGGAEDKTFTQEQVNSMIAAEKRKNLSSVYKGLGFDSEEAAKAFVDKYKGEEEKNKTDLVKAQERASQLEAEKSAEAAKAQDLQYRFDAMAEGCDAKSAADVVVLAKAKMSDDKDFAAALKEVKEQYPAMFGQTDNGNGGGTGGGGTSPRQKLKSGDLSGIGKRLAEQRKQNNTTKDHDYFK
jgi:hypothetical protein